MADDDDRYPFDSFFHALHQEFPDLQDWPRSDADGPWLIVSYDFLSGNGIVRTLRLDYDGESLRGGWSPGFLNWDGGMRAEAVPVDTSGPDGLFDQPISEAEAVRVASVWFREHLADPNRFSRVSP